MSESLICKLSPSSVNLRGGSGGIPDITALDIAGGLSYLGLSDFETRYLRARILQSESWHERSDLALAAWDWAKTIEIQQGWVIPRGSYLTRKLSYLAVDMRIRPEAVRCGGCRGTGVYRPRDGNTLAACRRCAGQRTDKSTSKPIGNGLRRISAREYALTLGVTDKTFSATWAARLDLLTGELLEVEHRARYLAGVVFDDDV